MTSINSACRLVSIQAAIRVVCWQHPSIPKEALVLTVMLLICSNAFMTLAWYGHLKFPNTPLVVAILLSWLIALAEYSLQVPANRLGYEDPASPVAPGAEDGQSSWWHSVWRAKFSGPQLKIIQEVIAIVVFVVFNALYLKNVIRPTDWIAFGLIILAVVVMMYPRIIEGTRLRQAVLEHRPHTHV